MSLSATLSTVQSERHDYPIKGMTGESFFHSVHADPTEMQKAICEAIAELVRDGQPQISRLEALLALERQTQPVIDLLLTQYVEGDAHIGSFEWKAWNAALRLSQTFGQAHEYFLHHIAKLANDYWTDPEPLVRVQLFHHRKVELLLRLLRYKKRSPEIWKQLHQIYGLAHERDLLSGLGRTAGELEQQYLQILLLEVMNNGRFSPREALWAYRWFARWCGGQALRLAQANRRGLAESKGFVVDLDGSDGLKRPQDGQGDLAESRLLYFDSSPLRTIIDQETTSLRESATLPEGTTPASRAGQLALLHKLAILFAPVPVDIKRRAERKPVALAVQAIAGFQYIVGELHRNGQRQSEEFSSTAGPATEDTDASFGHSLSPDFASIGSAGAIPPAMAGVFDSLPQIWQVKDRSDSGCRMRAQVDDLNGVIPGSLIAVRESQTAPWVVSVVRWFRRLMVDYVEIGVEYLGREPRFVKLVTDGDVPVADAPNSASRCFAALYLPPSAEYPTMPIKTLLLPASDFRTDSDVTLLSSSATYRMRLSEPIQQQYEYVWTSFALIDESTPLDAQGSAPQ
ncbi:MAG TPA: hypothetical protein VH704_07225 [Casimicrobiaceae bacterium]|nr:hypothetical protein [Casimicrobiaceae bacterium]